MILGFVWPEPNSSAAGQRMMKLIRLFRSQNWEVSFASAAAKSEYAVDLESRDIDCYEINVNSSEFDSLLQFLEPTVVLFDRFIMEEQFGWRVAEHCPKALRVLDTEDLHCLRRTRQKAVAENRPFSRTDLLEEEISKREVASIFRSDLSLIISEYEMDILKHLFKVDDDLLHYLPFMETELKETEVNMRPGFQERRNFITIGNFSHGPNLDAVKYLKERVWPRIHNRLPGVEMHIYGAYPTQEVRQLHDPGKNFLVKGRAENAEKVVKYARVMLAPLRFGAGLKGKLLEAMSCGTPSVTTHVGSEGMRLGEKWNGFIADEPEQIADSAIKLYENEHVWKEAVKNGNDIINKKFADKEQRTELIHNILKRQRNLKAHRRSNFTGSMLMHHTMASTRYMSRWIEEKNKK